MPEAHSAPFCHFWHLVILWFSEIRTIPPNTGGVAISWLGALKNLGAETTQEKEIDTDAPSSAVLSESLIQQGAKSDKSPSTPLLEGMDTVLNGTDEVDVSVEIEARIARSWGDEGER